MSLTLNLLLTIALQQLWGMINSLQLELHIPLFKIALPPNILTFFQALFNVMTFDFFNTSDVLQRMFSLRGESAYPAFNERFEFLGYGTTNVIYNMGLPMFFIMGYLLLLCLYGLTFGLKRAETLRVYL